MTRTAVFERVAPAKLNLTLAVIRRLPDGYHALHSVMAPLALADTVSLRAAPPAAPARGDAEATRGAGAAAGTTHGAGVAPADTRAYTRAAAEVAPADSITVTGFDPGDPGENLVLRAIEATRLAVSASWPGAPAAPPPLVARLTKKIPVAAGLGGGSSDAAAAMDAALEAWDARLTVDRAIAVAASLGSDVPFFLAGGVALVAGRGEAVTPLRGVVGEPPAILLVTPRLAVSTRAVYEAFEGGARPTGVAGASRMASQHLAAEMQRGLSARQLLDRAGALAVANDLIPASVAVVPALLPFRRALARLLERPIGQSGSGPTAWVMYASLDEAKKASSLVKLAYRDGRLPPTGDGEPFVAATQLLVRDVPTAQGGS